MEEVTSSDLAAAAGSPGDECRVQSEHHGGQIGGGIGVRNRTADGAAMPYLRIADLGGRGGKQRQLAAQQLRLAKLVVAGKRAHGNLAVDLANVTELADPADIHER